MILIDTINIKLYDFYVILFYIMIIDMHLIISHK